MARVVRVSRGDQKHLKEGRLDRLSKDYWANLIRSLITDEILREWDYAKPLPAGLEALWVSMPTPVPPERPEDQGHADRESLQDHLPVKTRIVFAEAFTDFMKDTYRALRRSGYKREEDLRILDTGLLMSESFGGVIRADLLEKMALDRQFSHRTRAALGLVSKRLRGGAPESFWKKIEGDLLLEPSLLSPLMASRRAHYRDEFGLLKHFAERPNWEGLKTHVGFALEDLQRCVNWRSVLRRHFAALPPWFKEMMTTEFAEFIKGYEKGQ